MWKFHTLTQHYGFTDEGLDFIINYDIKYRIGAGPVLLRQSTGQHHLADA